MQLFDSARRQDDEQAILVSIDSEISLFSQRTEPAAEIKPLRDDPNRGSSDKPPETDFLKQLQAAMEKLMQRDDMEGCSYSILREGRTMVVILKPCGEELMRLTPEQCLELSEKKPTEGLLFNIHC